MATLNFGGLRETRNQVLRVIGQKFTSEWVTHLHIMPHNNSRYYDSLFTTKNSFSYSGTIPCDFREAVSMRQFKRLLKGDV